MSYFLDIQPALVTLPIVGSSSLFPVRRVYCVGRNYAAHAREMGKDPDREPPFFFMKPATSIVAVNGSEVSIPYPSQTKNYHHEIELVAAIGSRAENVSVEQALRHVCAYAVGLDMTRRDVQLAARDAGRPWEMGKSFAYSAPIGPLHDVTKLGHPSSGAISLTVNDQVKQRADLSELIWSVAECISHLSALDALEPGDLLFTGTPAGVGAVVAGDRLHGSIEGIGDLRIRIGS
ncbi:fumarylacetoacetate hydrolase family protein [Steroidobacter sp.]|uniref:fumarylacetoacetate hydrolase family protein n=1 Tax=Steroidobacter sp. TaxID=1978227 RepID=UPI001A55482C|nr:fumarylacetoacetate hydrolase family protein [Steroidobacter sp.]MBL8270041.1 fumarylacetoacetate hydrolase family protein [Steroidobacter sp.]